MRVIFAAAAVLISLTLSLSEGGLAQDRPNILLITLDTTRADRMGFLGSTRGLTPALDALARTSTIFTRAYAQAPITTVSHATILSGTYPPFHHVNDFGSPLPATVPYLPDLLRRSGYRTAAFVGSLVLDPRTGTAPGFDRGFDVYDAGFRLRRPGEDRYRTLERRGDEVTARAMRWIARGGSTPWFAWVHLYDAHDPYDPPADLKRRFAAALYDGEIAAIDRMAGTLVQSAGPGAVVAVTADHGESLGDHGEETHGVFLYDAVLHVPLLIRLPEGRGAGAGIDARVRLADLAPTLLDAAGLSRPSAMQGESMMPLVPLVRLKPDPTKSGAGPTKSGAGPTTSGAGPTKSRADPTSVGSGSSRTDDPAVSGFPSAELGAGSRTDDRPAYAETEYPRQAFGWSMLASWRSDRFLLVRAPKPELYDVIADPGATRNLAATRPRLVSGMAAELERFLTWSSGSGGAGRAGGAGLSRVDPAVAERLAALGYVSGSGASALASGSDPKDKIAIANGLHTAVVAVDEGAFAKAIPLLERVTVSEPGIQIAQLHLGVARARQRQYALAVTPLTRAVALQPVDMRAQYELGAALYETGDLKKAATHFAIVASSMPGWADARYSLGSVYARIDRIPDAITELRAALDLEPRHFRANLLLGRILTLRGEASLAVPFLRTAVDVQPDSSEAKQFLAEALAKSR